MAQRIYKYPLDLSTTITKIEAPKGIGVLSTGLDPQGDLCIWASVDPSKQETEEIVLATVWTGDGVPNGLWDFLGTVLSGGLVYHVFTGQRK